MSKSVAIITGASQGIGQATAVRLSRGFSALVLVARKNADTRRQEGLELDAKSPLKGSLLRANLQLKTMKTADRRRWSQGVLSELRTRCNLEADKFVFLAGTAYRENLVPHLNHYQVPMEGLPFGKQLQWLDRHLR